MLWPWRPPTSLLCLRATRWLVIASSGSSLCQGPAGPRLCARPTPACHTSVRPLGSALELPATWSALPLTALAPLSSGALLLPAFTVDECGGVAQLPKVRRHCYSCWISLWPLWCAHRGASSTSDYLVLKRKVFPGMRPCHSSRLCRRVARVKKSVEHG